jgi:hypothetical protein
LATETKDFKVKNGAQVGGGITAGSTIIGPVPTTSLATFRLPHGTAPSAPTDGDLWTTTAGAYVRINGSTIGPLGTGGASVGDPVYIQATQPTGTRFMWWDISTSVPTLWIEDGT